MSTPSRLPPAWLALALLAWGGFTDNLAGGVVMAALIEGIAAAPLKWQMSARDFHRAADLTSVVFALVTVLQFSRHGVHGIYSLLAATPYCFFPLLVAQRASVQQSVPLSALFYSLRRAGRLDERIDLAPHYVCACVIAASTGGGHPALFSATAIVLCVGLIARARPRRYRWWQWSATLACAVLLALAGQNGVQRGQRALEAAFMYWLNQFPWMPGDPNSAVTAIGSIGRLKLSDQIRVRVAPDSAPTLPLVLLEASYDTFKYGTWHASAAPFAAIDKLRNRDAWAVVAGQVPASAALELTFQHRRELTLLPVPAGASLVTSSEIAELQSNRFGTLMAEAPAGALRYAVSAGARLASPPEAADRVVPAEYAKVIAEVMQELGPTAADAAAMARRIERHFHTNFHYSLVQPGRAPWRTPLAHFLTRTRRGHCEYFASASVLLLRAAGIPARYAVGYVVDEYSPLEGAYIARARHAHAWALAWIDGTWVRVDSTPARWFELEDARASGWQRWSDLAAWLGYRYQRLSRTDPSVYSRHLLWLVAPLAAVLYWRLRRSPRAVRAAPRTSVAPGATDVLMAPLLERLAARGLEPLPGETLARFMARAAPLASGGVTQAALLIPYYRLRYAPLSAPPHARAALAADLVRYCAAL